jgi:hypothetical protein
VPAFMMTTIGDISLLVLAAFTLEPSRNLCI